MLLLLRELGKFVYVAEKLSIIRVGLSEKSAGKYAPGLPHLHIVGKRALRCKTR